MKNMRPTTAGQTRTAAGRSVMAQPWTPTLRNAQASMSWMVANGSTHSQTGATSADSIATPTQP